MIPEAFGLANGDAQLLAYLPQRDIGSKDFERPRLAPPAHLASAPAEQFPARLEHHIDINLVPHGKLTRAQRFEILDTLPPKSR
jgi:hypothetical protein